MSKSLNKSIVHIDSSFLNHGLSFDEYIRFHQSIIEDKLFFHSHYKEHFYGLCKDNLDIILTKLKDIELDKKLYNLIDSIESQHWILFLEPWCIDSAHILPVLYSIAQCSDKIEFNIQLRDKNREFLNLHLSEEQLSIPKLMILNFENRMIAKWGAMPKVLKDLTNNMKSKEFSPKEISDFRHEWYKKDGSITTQMEIYELLKSMKNNENL